MKKYFTSFRIRDSLTFPFVSESGILWHFRFRLSHIPGIFGISVSVCLISRGYLSFPFQFASYPGDICHLRFWLTHIPVIFDIYVSVCLISRGYLTFSFLFASYPGDIWYFRFHLLRNPGYLYQIYFGRFHCGWLLHTEASIVLILSLSIALLHRRRYCRVRPQRLFYQFCLRQPNLKS
jgi:hypothetical protein